MRLSFKDINLATDLILLAPRELVTADHYSSGAGLRDGAMHAAHKCTRHKTGH